jgi:O-acetyl-ADP-ribose deacetylase (regulator of RNase III)
MTTGSAPQGAAGRAGRGDAPSLAAILADITTLEVDVVVNAANRALAGGGGVDGAIHRAAGARTLQAACRALGGCEPGDAKATPGFALPARWIVHTVGPVWGGGDRGEDALLTECYRRSFQVAESLGASTVAYPAISTGVYGFPAERAAALAVRTLRSLRSTVVREVLLVAFDRSTLGHYQRHLGATGEYS